MTAGVKISALPSVASLMGSSIAPFVQAGQTVRGALWMLPFDPAGTGAQRRTIQSKLQDYVSRGDFPLPADYQAARAALLGSIALPATDIIGLLNLAFAGAGNIAFPAVQHNSSDPNVLDDYEEGIGTPAFTCGTPGDLTVTYSVQNGTYTKIGRLVVFTFRLVTSSFTWTTSSGNFQISGVPFASATFRFYGALSWSGVTKAGYTNIVARMGVGTSLLTFTASGSGVAASALAIADVPSGGTVDFEGTIVYEAAT